MKLSQRLHALHRFWRYRLNTERDSLRFILQQDLRGTTVLDVGANYGAYSYWLSRCVGPAGRVIAFEPQAELIDYLGEVKSAFRLDNLTLENVALSDVRTSGYLHRDRVGSGGATVTHEPISPIEGLATVSVETDTLDSVLRSQGSPRVSFVKCDVEGHELRVFQGATETLTRDKPTLLFEGHHVHCEEGSVFSLLEELGYAGFFFEGRRRYPHTRFADVPYHRDCRFRNYIFQHPRATALKLSQAAA